MPDTEISLLLSGAPVVGTDRIPVARSPFAATDNFYITPTMLKTFLDAFYELVGTSAAGIAAHEAAANPHPTYLTAAEGDAAYDAIGAAAAAQAASQPLDADLTNFAGLDATAGFIVKTGAATHVRRSIDVGSSSLEITNPAGTAGNPSLALAANAKKKCVGIVIDGGGSVITTGIKGDAVIPFTGTITGWTLIADQAGSIVIDVWKDVYANYPPTVADTIAGTELPTLTAVAKNQDNALSTWTTAVTAGDIVRFNVNSVATVTRVTLLIEMTLP